VGVVRFLWGRKLLETETELPAPIDVPGGQTGPAGSVPRRRQTPLPPRRRRRTTVEEGSPASPAERESCTPRTEGAGGEK